MSSRNSKELRGLLTEHDAARATREVSIDCFIVAGWKYIQSEITNGR